MAHSALDDNTVIDYVRDQCELSKGKVLLERFNYQGVTLGDSPLKRQFDEVRDFYLRIPNDDLLRPYRLRAGLPAPGADLGQNYIDHNTFGQVVSGLSLSYAATGDVACRDKAIALVRAWAKCIEPDGFFLVTRTGDHWKQFTPYSYDKMVCGLVDVYLYCGDKQTLAYLNTITDWAIANLNRSKPYATPIGPAGVGTGEWYTLSENLYRAYLVTGDAKYRDFAGVWEYTEFWKFFEDKTDIFERPMGPDSWYHAYSHVNSFNSLAAAYLVNGDARYLEALKYAYDFMWNNELYATGGYGPGEHLMPRQNLAGTLSETTNHFETQCGSWAAFNMTKYLMQFTGDAKYGDWTELLIYNGIGASIPMDASGEVFYFSEYSLGGSAKKNIWPWACCSGTRTQAVADLHDLIYLKDENGIYVNLYTPSTVTWNSKGGKTTIAQKTRFPESQTTEFIVSVAKPAEFVISVRNPGWLVSPMKAWINGDPVQVDLDSLHWARFRRNWKDGDRLVVELPMNFCVSRIDPQKEYPAAIMYGPVTMASRCEDGNPSHLIDLKSLPKNLAPVDGQALNFHLASNPSVLIRPFYQYKAGERYFMYLDPAQK